MKKKIVAGLLTASMVLCSAEALPSNVLSGLGVGVTVQAASYGDYEYNTLKDGTVELIGYNGTSTNVTIPEKVNGKSVTKIGDEAFYASNIKTVTIPKSVITVGKDAFRESLYLNSVKFLGGTTSIGAYTFYGCKSLKSVTLNNGLKTIDGYAFYNCSALKSIEIPDSVISVGGEIGYCFANCSSLESATLSANIAEIKDDTFSWCTSLKSIRIPDKVKSIGWQAFSSCTSMERVIMPNSLKEIKEDGFNRCKGLKSVSIPNSVTIIGDGAFENCTSLFEIVIPNSVEKIGKYAFGYIHATGAASHEKIKNFTLYGSTLTAENYAKFYAFKYVDVRLSKGSVSLNKSIYAYNKNGIKADVTVKNSAGDKLEVDKDFEVTLDGKIKCGKMILTIKGMGKYTESFTKDIIIKPAKVKGVKVKSPKAKRIKVTWKTAGGDVTGYEIQVARNKKFTKSLKTINIKKAAISKKTIKKLKNKKKYFVRIRAYKTIDNTKYYGDWSQIKSKKIKSKKAKSKKAKSKK